MIIKSFSKKTVKLVATINNHTNITKDTDITIHSDQHEIAKIHNWEDLKRNCYEFVEKCKTEIKTQVFDIIS